MCTFYFIPTFLSSNTFRFIFNFDIFLILEHVGHTLLFCDLCGLKFPCDDLLTHLSIQLSLLKSFLFAIFPLYAYHPLIVKKFFHLFLFCFLTDFPEFLNQLRL